MTATQLSDAKTSALEQKYSDPRTGSIMRRHIQRLLNNVIAVGPSGPVAKPHTPPTLDEMIAADRKTVADEIAAIDRRIRDIDQFLALPAKSTSAWGSGADYESQELRSERQCLRALRAEIENDQRNPITRDRDGKPLDLYWRMVRRARAAELRESCWGQAEMFRQQGLFRESRRWRLDALRARHLAESELGMRPSTTTYW